MTQGGLLGLQPAERLVQEEEDFFEWAGLNRQFPFGAQVVPETVKTTKPPVYSPPSASSGSKDKNRSKSQEHEFMYTTKVMPEMLYVKRRILDLPDWALSKPNMELGFTTVADEEIHAEELIALFRPRFIDNRGDQVHEDASFEWKAQSIFQSRRMSAMSWKAQSVFNFGSPDQDRHNIAMRRYVWSYGKGELQKDVEDEKEEDHNNTTIHPQVLSAPKRMRHYHNTILQARAQDTDSSNFNSIFVNEEAWSPFAAETPAKVPNYEWNSNEYPARPVQLQHDLD